jgi:peptidoglycan/LPS O-acetylase OafA/YrhL
MFAGTVVYRAQHGQTARLPAVLSLITVGVGAVGSHRANPVWVATVVAVTVTFAIAYAMKNRPVPAALTWLGQISYSLYLLHAIVLLLIPRVFPDLGAARPAARLAAGFAYLVVVTGLARLSYRMVELPGRGLGRRLTARLTPRPPAGVPIATQRAAPGTGRGENERESV